jgi:caffeoyl-CoA O-methyltransferase
MWTKYKLMMIIFASALAVVGAMAFIVFDDVKVLGYFSAPAPPSANTEVERKVLAVLDEMERTGKTYLSVSERTGRILRLLTEVAGAKHVAEIGTSTGYSGLWFCLALQMTGGRLTTFEIDPGRAAMARENFKKAGVEQLVTVVEGDAHRNLAQLKGPIDVAFLDADKEGYPDYLNRFLPLVRPGGLIIADNANMSPAYLKAITGDPALETLFWAADRNLAITLKKR